MRAPRLDELPFFNPDIEADPPSSVHQFRDQVRSVEGVIIACPEYGHSLPGALKNAIDWLIPSGELYQKRAWLTCAVAHPERGRRGLAALEQTLRAVDVELVFSAPIVASDLTEFFASWSK